MRGKHEYHSNPRIVQRFRCRFRFDLSASLAALCFVSSRPDSVFSVILSDPYFLCHPDRTLFSLSSRPESAQRRDPGSFSSPRPVRELCIASAGRRSVRRDSSLQQLSLRMTRVLPRPLFHGRGGRPPCRRQVRVQVLPPFCFCVILNAAKDLARQRAVVG